MIPSVLVARVMDVSVKSEQCGDRSVKNVIAPRVSQTVRPLARSQRLAQHSQVDVTNSLLPATTTMRYVHPRFCLVRL